jgi:AcrR family transcriptional regulator
MLDVGMGEHYRARGAERVAEVKCQVLLYGIAEKAVKDEKLDGSAALRAADDAIATWTDDDGDDTAARIRAAARQEFARRGYEVTTVRDIAAAAGLSAGGVYRHIESKDALYWSIMQSYMDRITDAWARVVRSSSTPLEKLDGLLWLTVNETNRFAAEHKIQEAGQRYSPSTSQHLVWSAPQIRALKRVLLDGVRARELRMDAPSVEMWARCVFALAWERESIVRKAGLRGAWSLGRDTVLRGAATRRPRSK